MRADHPFTATVAALHRRWGRSADSLADSTAVFRETCRRLGQLLSPAKAPLDLSCSRQDLELALGEALVMLSFLTQKEGIQTTPSVALALTELGTGLSGAQLRKSQAAGRRILDDLIPNHRQTKTYVHYLESAGISAETSVKWLEPAAEAFVAALPPPDPDHREPLNSRQGWLVLHLVNLAQTTGTDLRAVGYETLRRRGA